VTQKSVLAGVILVAAVHLTSAALAGANDYAFEPVKADVTKGDAAMVVVRLMHKPTGKPVSDAVIFASRIDMAPEGMPTMTAQLTAVTGGEPGTYGFKTELSMAGGWQLTLSAKVQGEAETVTGKVVFKATE